MKKRHAVLGLLAALSVITFIDRMAIAVTGPAIQKDLGLTPSQWGWVLGARSREKDPGFPLMYAPPEGIGPAQARYVLREEVDRETFVATIMYAAEKDAVELGRQGEAWTLTDKGGAQGWAGVDPVTAGVAKLQSAREDHVNRSTRDDAQLPGQRHGTGQRPS